MTEPGAPRSDEPMPTMYYTGEECPSCADDGGVGQLYSDGQTIWCERCDYMRDEFYGAEVAV